MNIMEQDLHRNRLPSARFELYSSYIVCKKIKMKDGFTEARSRNTTEPVCSAPSSVPLLRLEQLEDGVKPWQAGDKDAPR